jgi:hypothetical protein
MFTMAATAQAVVARREGAVEVEEVTKVLATIRTRIRPLLRFSLD